MLHRMVLILYSTMTFSYDGCSFDPPYAYSRTSKPETDTRYRGSPFSVRRFDFRAQQGIPPVDLCHIVAALMYINHFSPARQNRIASMSDLGCNLNSVWRKQPPNLRLFFYM